MALGISVACTATDEDKGTTPNLIDLPDPDPLTLLEEFTINYAGTYTSVPVAVLTFQGRTMTFNGNTTVTTTSTTNGDIYLDIFFNGAQDGSEIQRIMFTDGNIHGAYTQSVTPSTSTNVILENLYMFTTSGTIDGGDTVSLTIDPITGNLSIDNVVIGIQDY